MHGWATVVVGSMVAAMYSHAEDARAFLAYAVMLSLSFAATLLLHDVGIVFSHWDHWIEPRIGFYGVHAVVLAMLFYCHQGGEGAENDGEKFSADVIGSLYE
jgi:O-antigen ligase